MEDKMSENKSELKERFVKSKCMVDMFVYFGFEYEKRDEYYVFKRTRIFDIVWKRVHQLKNDIKLYKSEMGI